ncbi:hypothetical protein AX16_002123, partial [Volvariella volvacea WC 439]
MHLLALNEPELWIGLWHGEIKAVGQDSHKNWEWLTLIDDAWAAHRKAVAH